MSDIAISVEGLSKRYRIGGKREQYRTFRDTIANAVAAPIRRVRSGRAQAAGGKSDTMFWALKDVSFQVKKGEAIGIIGRNGAGKSTLLKILSRITEPTAGQARIQGRVASLLEVGTGFHNELTGRENVFLNGTILGMKREEIQRKFDEIIAFAEIDKFVDTPVKHYSSGMYLRLAFAVAAHLDTEILLVDEVLAVGDLQFQRKCLGKMDDASRAGRSVIFVSHDMSAILRLAPSAILLKQGAIQASGPTDQVISLYNSMERVSGTDIESRLDRTGDGSLRLKSIAMYNSEGQLINSAVPGQSIKIVVGFSSTIPNLNSEDVVLDLHFTDLLNHRVATVSTRFNPPPSAERIGDVGYLQCVIPHLPLTEGIYTVDMWLAYRGVMTDALNQVAEIEIFGNDYYGTGHLPVLRKHGALLLTHNWSVVNDSPSNTQ